MQVLRTADLARITGLSRTTIWRLERQGEFPQRIRLGRNAVGWRNEEVERWVESRPRGVTLPDASHSWTAGRKDEKAEPRGQGSNGAPYALDVRSGRRR